MATFFRVSIPDDDGVVTVSTSATALSTCAVGEIAVYVGTSVALARTSQDLREELRRWADTPRVAPTSDIGATNRRVWAAAPAEHGEAWTYADSAQATTVDEATWGIVMGNTSVTYLDRSLVILAALERINSALTAQLGT